jgi:hypothetical protein
VVEVLVPLFFFVVVALIVGGIVWSYYAKRKRVESFQTLAPQLGLSYAPEDPFGILGWAFALFQRGDGQGVENVLSGTWQGIDLTAFDFWYYDESTDSKGSTSRSYSRFDCAITTIDAACSHLTVDHENLFTRIADALALKDLQFESEEFNRGFNVKSKDERFAYAFVDARMMRWLLGHAKGYAFEVLGDRLLVAGPKIQPMEFLPLLGTLKAFRDQVPRAVFSLYPKSG